MADLIYAHIEHDLWLFIVELLHQLGAGFNRALWTSYLDDICRLSGADKTQLQRVADDINQLCGFLRRGMRRYADGCERHPVILFVILRVVGEKQELMAIERRPHRLGYLAGQSKRGKKIQVIYVERHPTIRNRIIKLDGHLVCRRNLREERPSIPREMEGGAVIRGLKAN